MTSRLDRIVEQRLAKVASLRADGVDPYPRRYHRSHTAQEALELFQQAEGAGQAGMPVISLAGRLTAQRQMGKSAFLDIQDGSGKIQLFCSQGKLDEASRDLLKTVDIGDIIGAGGRLFRTRTGQPSLEVANLTMLAKSLRPLPEKWHGLSDTEIRYRQRYLDLIANAGVKAVFQKRGRIISAIRRFLEGRGFLEVDTPVLQPSAGGALARPFVTHHHALDVDFYLRIALELYLKRLIIGGFDRVYEIGRTFRNEGISTRHNPEFTLLESYQAYADYNDVMQMVEEMVAQVAREALGTTEVEYDGQTINFQPPWRRLGLRQAVIEYGGIDFVQYPEAGVLRARMREMGLEADPAKSWPRLVDELISSLVEPKLIQPTFLVDYPVSMSPLAKTKPGEERVVERFEAFAGGMEMANAFTELNDPVEQRRRFEEQQQERLAEGDEGKIDEDFLLALEHGMPPTGGLGVGIDRLVMLLTGQPSIREVILFPQLKDKP